MEKIVIRNASSNYDADQHIAELSKVLEVGYTKDDDELFISVDIAEDDHHITLSFDRTQFVNAVVQALLTPEDE